MKVKDFIATTNLDDNPIVHIEIKNGDSIHLGHYDSIRKQILRGDNFKFANYDVYFVRTERIGFYSCVYMYVKG